MEQAVFPLRLAPIACAASSITGIPRDAAISLIASIAATCPNRCTGMIALVLGDSFAFTDSGETLYVRGSMSAKTGIAPSRATQPAVAKNVNDGTITSSPG